MGVSGTTYALRVGDHIVIGNDLLELRFDLTQRGSLVALTDRVTGYEFLRDAGAPKLLFRLALQAAPDAPLHWLDNRQAAACDWSLRRGQDEATVVFDLSHFPDCDARVRVTVTVAGGAARSVWDAELIDAGSARTNQLTCPVLGGLFVVGDGRPGETVVVSRHGEGCLYQEPYPVRDRLPLMTGIGPDAPRVGVGEIHGRYPGTMSMQFMLYYNDLAGLYLATHDDRQNAKSFDLGALPGRPLCPVMSISHFPGQEAGWSGPLAYETILSVFHGDWYDGADLYKAWATRQWWCEKRLAERDIPAWMHRGFAVFQMTNYHIPEIKLNHAMAEIAGQVNQLSKEMGVPFLGLVFNFEGLGAWTGPVGMFPPREGEAAFREAMDSLRAHGNYGFVYIPGGYWYIANEAYRPRFDARPEYEAEAQSSAIRDASGDVGTRGFFPGWVSAHLCPHTGLVAKTTASMLLGCLERGVTVVQVDNFPVLSVDACYDPAHGHPPGYGAWWAEAWQGILSETRRRARALNPDCAMTTEGISEGFIPYLEMFDQRAGEREVWSLYWLANEPMGVRPISLFNYVYNPYIGSYDAAFPSCNRPEILYWARCFGKALTHGVIPTGGWYFPEPDQLNPITMAFWKKAARAAAQECWKYIMFGEMLRALPIDVPRIKAYYLRFTPDLDHLDTDNLHYVEDDAVQHSAWRAADGDRGYIFANVSEEPQEFSVTLDAGQGGFVRIDELVDGSLTTLAARASGPYIHQLHMEPLSVHLIEIKHQSDAKE